MIGWVGLCALAVIVSTVTATSPAYGPPRPGTEGNGLTEDEAATLWSRDDDSYITNQEYRDAYGENRSAVHDVANATDLTFKRPPHTAATWTKHDFRDLPVGGHDRSIHPPDVTLRDGQFIEDAHASIFAVHPTTHVHLDPLERSRYVAPNGTVRGMIDYRVSLPGRVTLPNRTIFWTLADARVDEIELTHGPALLATATETQTPELRYRTTDRNASFRLEATIEVSVARTTIITGPNGSRDRTVAVYNESVTVHDVAPVDVYDFEATVYQAEYPNGDAGVAIYQHQPWQGYSLTANGTDRVRGVWRFYTARDTSWDRLIVTTDRRSFETPSPARPVYVHAYPSEIGPRAEPAGVGPTLQTVWGADSDTPNGTLGENIAVEVVEQPYTRSYGVAARTRTVKPGGPTVHGIVRGVTATVTHGTDGVQPLHPSSLEATVIDQDEDAVAVHLRLTNATSGEPIELNSSNERRIPDLPSDRDGVIRIGGQTVETNATGEVTVTLTEPGVYTARYVPGNWVTHDPAYAPTATTVRWHPLFTVDGWLSLFTAVVVGLFPFAVAIYVGRHAARLIGFNS